MAIDAEGWKKFTEACQERLDHIKSFNKQYASNIDDLEIDTDEDGYYLHLEGDLVTSILKYLTSTDEKDPSYNKLTLKLDWAGVDKLDAFRKYTY